MPLRGSPLSTLSNKGTFVHVAIGVPYQQAAQIASACCRKHGSTLLAEMASVNRHSSLRPTDGLDVALTVGDCRKPWRT
jgi:hypothetical protein